MRFFLILLMLFISAMSFADISQIRIIPRHDFPIPTPAAAPIIPKYLVKWQNAKNGEIPRDATAVGAICNNPVYVCHAKYLEGVHPGQLVKNGCLISYGGKAMVLSKYQVLTTRKQIAWQEADQLEAYFYHNNENIPIPGGYEGEDQHPLFICRAMFDDIHIGKVVDNNCNISVNGAEVIRKAYKVLFLTKVDLQYE
jgi:hypothetical protein